MCFNLNIFNVCFSTRKKRNLNNKNNSNTIYNSKTTSNNHNNNIIKVIEVESTSKKNSDSLSNHKFGSIELNSSGTQSPPFSINSLNTNNNKSKKKSIDSNFYNIYKFNKKITGSNNLLNKLISTNHNNLVNLTPSSTFDTLSSKSSSLYSTNKNIFVEQENFNIEDTEDEEADENRPINSKRKAATNKNKHFDIKNSNSNYSFESNKNININNTANNLLSTSTTLNNLFYFDSNNCKTNHSDSISTRSTNSIMSKSNNDDKLDKLKLFVTPKPSQRPVMNMNFETSINDNKAPELKLETLKLKKQAFYFNNKDELFAKPNQLIEEANELSNELNEKIKMMNKNEYDDLLSKPNKKHHHHHHHSNHHHHHHHKSKGGKITISPEQVYEFKESDLKDLGQIGNGEFGIVNKVLHMPSQTYMALKRIGPTVGNQGERKKVLKELDFVMECNDYSYVVKFYGVKFNNEPADCLILMELMDTSLEKFYKFIYDVKKEEIPEPILGKIVVSALNALNYLKEQYQIIHRDVKPSNMLINRHGQIKMCDFGISGKLVDSIAASRDAGCQLYMAPERIDPTLSSSKGYDVRSDVWSLGITLYELATGKFPYPPWKTIFHQLTLVVNSDAPQLESERLSLEFKDFVNTCLTKDEKARPKYKTLMHHPFVEIHTKSNVNVAEYVHPYIIEIEQQQQQK